MDEPLDDDTAAISNAPKFHKDRSGYADVLRGWLTRTMSGVRDVEITELQVPVSTGFSNETVLFTATWRDDGGSHTERFVARIEPPDGGIFPVQTPSATPSVALQQRIMAAVAAEQAAPVPRVLGYEPDPAVLGQPFFVMHFVDGVVPSDQPRYTQAGFLVDEATPAERRRMVESGLAAMAGLHAVDWRRAGLEWLDRSGTGNPTTRNQIELYREYTTAELQGRAHPVMDAALDWLEKFDPDDERVGLSWGDSRLGNIIWQDYTPAAVVDWEACALSPTEADVGWWLMFDRMSFDEFDTPRLDGFPTREEMVAHYTAVSGREVRDPHYWEVFATMRFCAIFIRLGDRMTAAGTIPPDLNPAIGNGVTASLARLLEIENPTPPAY